MNSAPNPPPMPWEDQLALYAKAVRADLWRLPLLETNKSGGELEGPPLLQIYVEPVLRRIAVPKQLEELATGVYDFRSDMREWEESSISRENEEEEDQWQDDPGDLISRLLSNPSYRHWVILGGPGHGKSSILRMFALRWAQARPARPVESESLAPEEEPEPVPFPIGTRAETPDYMHHGPEPVPLLIEIRDYLGHLETTPHLTLLEYLCLERGDGRRFEYDALCTALRKGEAALLIDGLDEAFDPDVRREIARDVLRMGEKFPQARIAITSRTAGFEYRPWLHSKLAKLEARVEIAGSAERETWQFIQLAPFDRRRALAFLNRWHQFEIRNSQVRGERLEALRNALRDHRYIRDLASNPLLLTLLCLVARTGGDASSRRYLYERAVDIFVVQWEAARELSQCRCAQRRQVPPLSLQQHRAFLMRVAAEMVAHDGPGRSNRISESQACAILATILQENDDDRAEAQAADLLRYLRECNYILQWRGDAFVFAHRSFLEYFVALGWKSADDRYWRLRSRSFYRCTYGRYRREDDWQPTLHFLTALLGSTLAPVHLRRLAAEDGWLDRPDGLVLALELAPSVGSLEEARQAVKRFIGRAYRHCERLTLRARAAMWLTPPEFEIFLAMILGITIATASLLPGTRRWLSARWDDGTLWIPALVGLGGYLALRLTLYRKGIYGHLERFVHHRKRRDELEFYKEDRARLLNRLRVLGRFDRRFIERFIKRLQSEWHGKLSAEACGHALRDCVGRNDEALEQLCSMVTGSNLSRNSRILLLHGLAAGWPGNELVHAAAAEAAGPGKTEERVRWAALTLLAEDWRSTTGTRDLLLAAVAGVAPLRDAGHRREAVKQLGALFWEDPGVSEVLLGLLDPGEREITVRRAAIDALSESGSLGDTPPQLLLATAGPDEEDFYVRWNSLNLLGRCWPQLPPLLPLLLEAARPQEPDAATRIRAMKLLRELWPDDPQAQEIMKAAAAPPAIAASPPRIHNLLKAEVPAMIVLFVVILALGPLGFEYAHTLWPSVWWARSLFDFSILQEWREWYRLLASHGARETISAMAKFCGAIALLIGIWFLFRQVCGWAMSGSVAQRYPGLSRARARAYIKAWLSHLGAHLFLCLPIAVIWLLISTWLVWRGARPLISLWEYGDQPPEGIGDSSLLISLGILLGGVLLTGFAIPICWNYLYQLAACYPALRRVGLKSYEIERAFK